MQSVIYGKQLFLLYQLKVYLKHLGDLMVWQRDVDARLSALLIFMRHFESDFIRSVHVSKVSSTYNTLICVVSTSNFFVLRPDENLTLQEWTWETLLNEQLGDKVRGCICIYE